MLGNIIAEHVDNQTELTNLLSKYMGYPAVFDGWGYDNEDYPYIVIDYRESVDDSDIKLDSLLLVHIVDNNLGGSKHKLDNIHKQLKKVLKYFTYNGSYYKGVSLHYNSFDDIIDKESNSVIQRSISYFVKGYINE